MSTSQWQLPNFAQQYAWIGQEIQRISTRLPLSQIAVISRNNAELSELANYLNHYQIPYSFEKAYNVLEIPQIQQLILILKFIYYLEQQKDLEADHLLPEILNLSFWQIPAMDVWIISSYSRNQRCTWLESMLQARELKYHNFKLQTPDKIYTLALAFLELKKQSANLLAVEIVDILLGNKEIQVAENVTWQSSFKDNYFNSSVFLTSQYQELLAGIKTLFDKLKTSFGLNRALVSDLIEKIELFEKNKIRLGGNFSYCASSEGVNLLTAHKAKGLEFECVFVINCIEEIWFKKGKAPKIGFPKNLNLTAEKDDRDDQIRLLYVALTRSKNELVLTTVLNNEEGKSFTPISFFVNNWQKPNLSEPVQTTALELAINQEKIINLGHTEKMFLSALLENYKLSVTHLLNYLDIKEGGPHKFLERNFLHFPTIRTPKTAYGTVLHSALYLFGLEFKRTKSLPTLEFLLKTIEEQMRRQVFNSQDYKKFHDKAKSDMNYFYQQKLINFPSTDFLEFDFNSQEVNLEGASLTGKLDRMQVNEIDRKILVLDYKSSKPVANWNSEKQDTQARLFKYKLQIAFYKTLIENSRDFGQKYTVKEGLIQFLEPDKNGIFTDLKLPIEPEFYEKTKRVIQKVFTQIQSLDFPKIDDFSEDYNGMLDFFNQLSE